MSTAFRICKAKYAKLAFSGEGAKLVGGRWTPAGHAVVYCSSSLALAALETFVHLKDEAQNIAFVAFTIQIPDTVYIEQIRRPPKHWRQEPPGLACMKIGSKWLKEHKSAVLKVPSVLIPAEYNVLLNPAHSDFKLLKISQPKQFGFDPRLWK